MIFEAAITVIYNYSDVSLGTFRDRGSPGGFPEGENKTCTLVYWQSSKVKRVVKSTLAAERFAKVEGACIPYQICSLSYFEIIHLRVKFC